MTTIQHFPHIEAIQSEAELEEAMKLANHLADIIKGDEDHPLMPLFLAICKVIEQFEHSTMSDWFIA